MKRTPIEVGQKFGAWTVIELLPSQKANVLVRCECGLEKANYSSALLAGKSTGCRKCRGHRHPPYVPPRAEDDTLARNEVWHEYRGSAKRRGYAFELDRETFFELVSSPCYYCGKTDSNEKKVWNKDWALPFKYNGIDRYVNSEGYVEGNVFPCCRICNLMKRELSYEEFMSHIKSIIAHQEGA